MNQRSIVIADDDCDLAQLLAMRCKSLGLTVYLAYDGFTALNLIRAHHPDVICLDLHMPSGDGLSLFQMILGDQDVPSTPLILMTGDTNEDTIRECHQMCAYYVEKCTDIWQRLEPLLRDLFEIPEVMAERMSDSHHQHRWSADTPAYELKVDTVEATQLAFAEWANTNQSQQPCVLCIEDDQD
jgi:CheY-like chemotaxis protein